MIESMPPFAGSGCGSEGWQMLLRLPIRPLDPPEQKPSRPPMSPIPGTEQMPPAGTAAGVAAAGVRPAGADVPGIEPAWVTERVRAAAAGWAVAATAVAADEPSTVTSRPNTSSDLRGTNLATESPEGSVVSVQAHPRPTGRGRSPLPRARALPARRARGIVHVSGWCPAIS